MSNPVPKDHADEESMIELVYRFDWSKTSLGDMSTWPLSLKNAVVCNAHVVYTTIILKTTSFYTKGHNIALRIPHVLDDWT